MAAEVLLMPGVDLCRPENGVSTNLPFNLSELTPELCPEIFKRNAELR